MKPCVFLSSKLILEQLELLLPSKSLVVDVVVVFFFVFFNHPSHQRVLGSAKVKAISENQLLWASPLCETLDISYVRALWSPVLQTRIAAGAVRGVKEARGKLHKSCVPKPMGHIGCTSPLDCDFLDLVLALTSAVASEENWGDDSSNSLIYLWIRAEIKAQITGKLLEVWNNVSRCHFSCGAGKIAVTSHICF